MRRSGWRDAKGSTGDRGPRLNARRPPEDTRTESGERERTQYTSSPRADACTGQTSHPVLMVGADSRVVNLPLFTNRPACPWRSSKNRLEERPQICLSKAAKRLLVPTLCVGTRVGTLCVPSTPDTGRRASRPCVLTRSVGTRGGGLLPEAYPTPAMRATSARIMGGLTRYWMLWSDDLLLIVSHKFPGKND